MVLVKNLYRLHVLVLSKISKKEASFGILRRKQAVVDYENIDL